ncbi:XK-related protein 8-like [Scomber japonicus]|uniref:XK-related protein 8-like n=1 Tax=Scomber japonicus TaxID=13676 RepID=UPI0023052F97|nr:XK-related protein 8-like [Scomber japonicus]
MDGFKYTCLDFFLTCVGLLFLLLDIVLDIFTVVSFYEEKNYVCLGVLVLFLVGSSVLVQAFSWLWYSFDESERETKVEKCVSRSQLKLLHVFQLGIYFRHAGVVEMSLRRFFSKERDSEGLAAHLSHDLSLLRLIETFSESSPQLVLMLTLTLQRGELSHWPVLKALGSALAIATSVTMYHRFMRSFLPKKAKQGPLSSLVYFLWNFLLIVSRLVALALFTSVLPCFIFTHFFCSWLFFFFFIWRCKTDFMDTPCGEWLYRATVGLIWYFDWFNVGTGKTRNKTVIYHGCMLVDITVLCGLWYWKMITDPPYFQIPQLYAIIIAASVVLLYVFGLLCKIIYYKFYHPSLTKDELKESPTEQGQVTATGDEVDNLVVTDRSMPSPAPEVRHYNKRMRKLAENFYAS